MAGLTVPRLQEQDFHLCGIPAGKEGKRYMGRRSVTFIAVQRFDVPASRRLGPIVQLPGINRLFSVSLRGDFTTLLRSPADRVA